MKIKSYASDDEKNIRNDLLHLFKQCPIPENEILSNLGLFIKRQDFSRLLFMHDLYKKIIDIHGLIIEFGVRWGQNLALFETFRGLYEPFNYSRKIIGFDTFEGFPSTNENDGQSEIIRKGAYPVTEGYEKYLEKILNYHEKESPISHIQKYHLIKGDATVEIKRFFEQYPETIVAFAYFDLDLYEPTVKCLEAIKDHVTKGSVIGFDELNVHAFPGETIALKEVFGLSRYKITRSKYSSVQSYIVID